MYKVAAVSYLNTLPFLYGLEHSRELADLMELEVDYPSLIADKLIKGEIDIGLVPVVVLKDHPQLEYVVPWGIVADGPVASVKLFSNRPLSEVEEIMLDYQSRTSVNLVRVLAKFHWKISPRWINAREGFEQELFNGSTAVVIGDRALKLLGSVKYEFDLAKEWKDMTGLPFVFAAWVANKQIDKTFIDLFNKALEYGVNNIDQVVKYYSHHTEKIKPYFDPNHYLSKYIKYRLTDQAHKSVRLFFDFLRQL